MAETNNLMLVHVKTVAGIVVACKYFFETDGVGKLVHATLRPINLNAGERLLQNRRALTTGEACNGFTAALIIRDVLTRAEVFQIGVDLRTNSHRRNPNRALDCAALLDRQDAPAINMPFLSVFSRLEEDYLIRISFDRNGDITITFLAVWAIILHALETLLARIA